MDDGKCTSSLVLDKNHNIAIKQDYAQEYTPLYGFRNNHNQKKLRQIAQLIFKHNFFL